MMVEGMQKRADRVGIADSAWRAWAIESFERLGYGSQKRCADETGLKPPDINKLLKGTTGVSEHQPIVTSWLLAQGTGTPREEHLRYLFSVLFRLDGDGLDHVAKTAKLLDPERKKKK